MAPAEKNEQRKQLTPAQRGEVAARLKAGEPGSALAREFGVSRQAVHQIKQRQDYLEGNSPAPPKRGRVPKLKLREQEWEQIKEQLLATKPADHGFDRMGDERRDLWSLERALQLSLKLTGRKPSRFRMKAVLEEVLPPLPPSWLRNLEPPVRLTRETLTDSQRADPELAAYLLSDVYWRIQQREHEILMEDLANCGEPPDDLTITGEEDGPWPPGWEAARDSGSPRPEELGAREFPAAPGVRVGKHKGSKRPPPKRKQKKRKKRR